MRYRAEDFKSYLKVGSIFKFADEEFLKVNTEHYFVCIGRTTDGNMSLMSCCTSQISTIEKLIESKKYSNETIVRIRPNEKDHPFITDTFINCNEYFEYYDYELENLNLASKISYHNSLPIEYLEQVAIGLKSSRLIPDDVKDTLIKEENIS
jgi:hypothetical protein